MQKRTVTKPTVVTSDSGDEDADDVTGLNGSGGDDEMVERSALVHTEDNDEEIHKIVAKREKNLPLEYLAQPLLSSSSTNPIPPAQLPKGGKAFEEKEFSSGLLILPPRSIKQRELTHTVESFIVFSAAPKSLQVTIGNTVFRLSKGDPFMVPCGNVYSLENLSAFKDVKVYFHLIRGVQDVEREVRSRVVEEGNGVAKGRGKRDGGSGDGYGKVGKFGKEEKLNEAEDDDEAFN
jgi:Mif2/CENP-C like